MPIRVDDVDQALIDAGLNIGVRRALLAQDWRPPLDQAGAVTGFRLGADFLGNGGRGAARETKVPDDEHVEIAATRTRHGRNGT